MQTPKVVSVKPIEDFKLLLVFENGENKIFDAKPYIHGDYMDVLADPRYFGMVKCGILSVEWPNGQDLCPDVIYEDSIPAQ